ncbi:NADP-dependent oxidoreductase domain-containing protein [Mycena albidolilacea]|uniref:NADP-dependent oxidoreductase domain-containing protein n=1 Tax=Mycena albidolilacea TaxID=1033008 RepID=A0AAD6ZAG9_9AGAR|nr:NADP-dependent oxidoreductase domain-containing protein [Mycena albidolilacea]
MSATRKIGTSTFPAIGFGAMGISTFYGPVESDEERFKVLDAAHAAGCRFWDTADLYGDSEELIGKWFKRTGKRADIFLCSKFGFRLPSFALDGTPEYVKTATESSLKKLGVDYIDLYYLHRADVNVPIEHTVAAMAEFVKAGKVKYLGLSEVSAATLRRAHAVHPIAAVQVEYAPFTLEIEDPKIGLLAAARELGIQVVAYSPLGRGLLTGQYKSPDEFEADDFRRAIPRYCAENFPNILKLADGLKSVGAKYDGATGGQVALAWLLAQGDDIIPIPGTKKIKYLEENIAAGKLKLSAEDVQTVRDLTAQAGAGLGERYPAGMIALAFADTPALP